MAGQHMDKSGNMSELSLILHIAWNVMLTSGYLLGAAAFIALKILLLSMSPARVFPDTAEYVAVAEQSLISLEFWAGERPFTLPLLYKALAINSENFRQLGAMERISLAQVLISAAGWLVAAVGAAKGAFSRTFGFVVFLGTLLFGLSVHVSQWDELLISESVSTSLFVMALGMILLGLSQVEWLRRRSFGFKLIAAMALGTVAVLFSFVRDSNLPLLLGGSIFAGALAVLVGLRRWSSWVPWILGLSGVLIVAGALQINSIHFSERWKVPYLHILHDRVLPSEAARTYFLENGMPGGEILEGLSGLNRSEFVNSVLNDPRNEPMTAWIEKRGRFTYAAYLAGRPLSVLAKPIRELKTLLHPLSTEYRHPESITPWWQDAVTRLIFPRSTAALLVLSGLAVAGLIHLSVNDRLAYLWAVPVFLIAASYPLMLLAWYGDGVEVERHAYQAAMQLRLGLVMVVLWIPAAEYRLWRRRREIGQRVRSHSIRAHDDEAS